jgi:hypothetical protein
MAGSSFYVSFNGRRFDIPEDNEPMVTIGGLNTKAGLRNGNGSVIPQKNTVPGAVRGLTPRLRTGNGDLEALQRLSGLDDVDMVYVGPDGNYTGTGMLVGGDDGIKQNTQQDVTEALDFICSKGQPLVRS